ncbi:MAG: hypothetical protein R3E87_14790 [Burkholderiaceae bacterium]
MMDYSTIMRAWKRACAVGFAAAFVSNPAHAGAADVLAVDVHAQGDGYRFSATIRSADRGWQRYCDRFEILAPDGRVLATRILVHPHVDEQPFTRSLDDVRIPGDVGHVVVRARMKPDGASGATIRVTWPP